MPSNRIQMVKGSKWRFTKDAEISRTSHNKEYDKERRKWWDQNREKMRGVDWDEAEKQCKTFVTKVLSVPETLTEVWGSVKAGDKFEITGKASANPFVGSGVAMDMLIGFYYPAKLNGKDVFLPLKAIDPIIEIDGDAPTVNEYVLRSRNTGKIYAGTNYDTPEIWSNDKQKYVPNPDYDPNNIIKYADTFMKGKRFKDAGKAKTHILGQTGYYDGLPGSENIPDWVGGPKNYDLPEDWELVKFDKLTKSELEIIDIQSWYRRTWQLRELTIKFGSPVRTLYNELDKKGKLDQFKGMLVVRAPIYTAHPGTSYSYTRYEDELDPKQIEELDATIEKFGFKSKDIKRAKDPNCVAIAFANTNAALKFRLSYSGNLQFNIIDLETLKETVDG